tara:strand:+ start:679 stop:1584 length:906 start_codon:yes stop_codon:yes gene_type:complete
MTKNLSPLRYPGGKSRGAEMIFEYIPEKTKEICSPFFGGGSIEVLCANHGMTVNGYDKFEPLADFWKCLLKRPTELAILVAGWWSMKPLEFDKENKKWIAGLPEFYEEKPPKTKPPTPSNYEKLKKELLSPKLSQLERAALFYVINRTSFSGSALSGGVTIGNPRFTETSIHRILDFKEKNNVKNITVECMDFRESIKKNKTKMMYLDPPYWLETKLYGEKGGLNFQEKDHVELFNLLSKCKKWILSYNDSKIIRETYKDYEIVPLEWAYGMKNYSGPKGEKKKKKAMPKSSEVLILSDGI